MIIRNVTERMEVALDTEEKVVWVIQRWRCRFVSERYNDKWKEDEMRRFRQLTRTYIEAIWSKAAHMVIDSTSGTAFNQTYGGTEFLVKAKLEFVECGEHWSAVIYKNRTPSNAGFMCWATREIYLTKSAWVNPTGVRDRNGVPAACQIIVAHEFGHMFGNTSFASEDGARNQYTGDEYEQDSPFYYDKCSIMNIGSELRTRHFAYLRDLLQSMVPGTQFSVKLGGVRDLIPWE